MLSLEHNNIFSIKLNKIIILLDFLKIATYNCETQYKKEVKMNWDEYFIGIAKEAALKSEDISTQVGCAIVDENNQVVSLGYNGFVIGANPKYMTIEKPMRYLLSIHAEMRALVYAKKPIRNCKIYVTHASCENCMKHLIESGVKEIIYDKLFTNGKFVDEEKAEAIIRLMKATGIIHRNMQGKSFIDDIKENYDLKVNI